MIKAMKKKLNLNKIEATEKNIEPIEADKSWGKKAGKSYKKATENPKMIKAMKNRS